MVCSWKELMALAGFGSIYELLQPEPPPLTLCFPLQLKVLLPQGSQGLNTLHEMLTDP